MAADPFTANDTDALLKRRSTPMLGGLYGTPVTVDDNKVPEATATPDPNTVYNPATGQRAGTRQPINPSTGVVADASNPAAQPAAPTAPVAAGGAKPSGLNYRPTSVAGIYAVKGPDGSTTFTDVPGGTFEQSQGSSAGGGTRVPVAGQGNFATGDLARNAPGLRYIRPTGNGVVDPGTKAGYQPGSPEWMRTNASVARGEGESDADYGNRVAAGKQAGLNFRTHSGDFALPAQSFDPSVIGPDAAYGRNGGGPGGGVPNIGMPSLEQAKVISGLKNDQQSRELAARDDQRKDQAQRQAQATERFNSARDNYLGSDKTPSAQKKQEADEVAHIQAARDIISAGGNPYADPIGRQGMQHLADRLAGATNPLGGGGPHTAPGASSVGDYDVKLNSPWMRAVPFSNRYSLQKRGGGARNFFSPDPVLNHIIGDKSENEDALQQFIDADRRFNPRYTQGLQGR